MEILLFNDTDGDYHFGCSGTSQALKHYLGISSSDYTHRVTDSWSMSPVPFSEDDFENDVFFENWKKVNSTLADKIKSCDLCVFTGEGTLHGYEERSAPRNLLYLMWICKTRFKKKVFAINQSCFPVYHVQDVCDNLSCRIYKKVLSVIDFLAVRENFSLAILNRMNVKAKLAFDCLPLYIHSLYKECKSNIKVKYSLISGGGSFV